MTPPNSIRQCATPGCFTLTRGSRNRLEDAPGSTIRMKGGLCTSCYVPNHPPCKGCGCKLRKPEVPASLVPDARQRYADGMCKDCWTTRNPQRVAGPTEPEPENPEKLAYTIKGLDSFIARRRARLGVAA